MKQDYENQTLLAGPSCLAGAGHHADPVSAPMPQALPEESPGVRPDAPPAGLGGETVPVNGFGSTANGQTGEEPAPVNGFGYTPAVPSGDAQEPSSGEEPAGEAADALEPSPG